MGEACQSVGSRALMGTAEELTGWKFEEAQGKGIDEIFRGFHEETCEPLENPLSVAIRRARAIKSVRPTLLIKRDGNEMYIESTASPIRDGSGAVSGGVLVFHDVSESRELNRKLSYHASHDILTGLVNRREFEQRLNGPAGAGHDLVNIAVVTAPELDARGRFVGDQLTRTHFTPLAARSAGKLRP